MLHEHQYEDPSLIQLCRHSCRLINNSIYCCRLDVSYRRWLSSEQAWRSTRSIRLQSRSLWSWQLGSFAIGLASLQGWSQSISNGYGAKYDDPRPRHGATQGCLQNCQRHHRECGPICSGNLKRMWWQAARDLLSVANGLLSGFPRALAAEGINFSQEVSVGTLACTKLTFDLCIFCFTIGLEFNGFFVLVMSYYQPAAFRGDRKHVRRALQVESTELMLLKSVLVLEGCSLSTPSTLLHWRVNVRMHRCGGLERAI